MEMVNRVKDVFVKRCCGTWCVFLETTTNAEVKIAYFTVDWPKGEAKAEAYAKKVKKFLKGEK